MLEQSAEPSAPHCAAADPAREFKRVVRYALDQVLYLRDIRDECPLFPQLVQIEPTNACNLRCVHCHHHRPADGQRVYTRRMGIMAMPLYHQIIDELAPSRTAISLNVQGEPTLHPQFLDMVAYAKRQGLHTSVLTNGTRLTPELTAALLRLGLDRIVFSFDAVDRAIYESIRIKSQFEPTLRNILHFIRVNHEHGHPTHVCLSMVEQQRNRAHAAAYERYFARLPVDKVFRNPLLNLSGAAGTRGEIDLAALQRGPRAHWPICRIAWEYLTVNWDGEASPCPVDVNVVYSLGNVRGSSLHEIWNNDRMRAFRRAHLTRDYTAIERNGPLCGSCNCLWDPTYDLRAVEEHVVESIYRTAVQHAHTLMPRVPLDQDERYHDLLGEIEKLEPACEGVR
ncbi:MAG TPA: radical SAM protein [Phycisphaerae bacterium]|nr:radical SAM protein [Phycisphaerae bacterium]HPM23138.1 radical SAM protein [Phycisphaerae bacterium]